jgi:hypothetical protein
VIERIAASIALGIFDWLAKRAERGSTARDADRDTRTLDRAADSLRSWMLAHGARTGIKPDPDRERLPK